MPAVVPDRSPVIVSTPSRTETALGERRPSPACPGPSYTLHRAMPASNSSARNGSPQPRVAAAVVPSTGPRAVDGFVFCFVFCGEPADAPAGGAGGSAATVTVVVAAEAGPASVAAGVPVPGARTTTTTAVPVAR